jgi:steroid delta-isomerase-like uncharacterized protein
MSEQNKTIARRVLDALWNQEHFAFVDEMVASDYDGHSSTVFHGPDGAIQFVPKMRHAFPDFRFTVEEQIAEADRVVTRWTIRGTHEGEFQGVPASGRHMTMTGITVFRVANGKLIEGWTNEDLLGLMVRIGAIPAPEQG